MFDVKDKVVLITGAAGGIGASVVRALMEEDVKHVAILDVDEANGLGLQEELNTKHGCNKVKFIKCDVTEEHELLNAFRTVRSEQDYIDVVINNAGIANEKMYIKLIEVNLTAVVRSSLEAWDLMRRDNGGRGGMIINIASIASLCSFPVIPVYGATKVAVVKFSTTLGDESHYARTGVRVLTVCFGATQTSIILKEKLDSFDPVIGRMLFDYFTPLKLQTPEQAAQGLIEVYKQGTSGSVWIVTNGKPAVDVTNRYMQHTTQYNDIIFS